MSLSLSLSHTHTRARTALLAVAAAAIFFGAVAAVVVVGFGTRFIICLNFARTVLLLFSPLRASALAQLSYRTAGLLSLVCSTNMCVCIVETRQRERQRERARVREPRSSSAQFAHTLHLFCY